MLLYAILECMKALKGFFLFLKTFFRRGANASISSTLLNASLALLVLIPITLLLATQQGAALRTGMTAYLVLLGGAAISAIGIASILARFRAFHEREQTFLESMGEGVCALDDTERIILWNKAAADFAGITRSHVVGKKFADFFSVDTSGNVGSENIIRDILSGKRKSGGDLAMLLACADGKALPVSGTATPLSDERGASSGCMYVFRDVTKEREIDRAKDEFVSFASHQLRTPLTNMTWRAEMLLEGDAGRLTKQQRVYLQEIEDGNRRMTNLVNAFLNVSRINLGTLSIKPEPCDVRILVNECIGELAELIKEKQLSIRTAFEGSAIVTCDPKILRIIIQNLLSNAATYTPVRGTVIVRLVAKGPELLLAVSDTGIGIPKRQQAKVFSKLFRADNVKKQHPDGTGLGLYIVKSLVDTSGGRVWFESQEKHGSTFCVALPVTAARVRGGTRSLIEKKKAVPSRS